MKKHVIHLTVNGVDHDLLVAPNRTLVQVLREELNLTGAKQGCGVGDCGSCTVLMNGQLVNSCLVLAVQAQNSEITTIEGLSDGRTLHPIQESFVQKGAVQCGFCTPGMILSAKALLDKNSRPTGPEIREGLSGNLCRCTGYQKIVEAVSEAAEKTDREGR